MNFQEAERTYQDMRAQYSAGKLSNTDFENEVSKLKVQDGEGRWWQIGVQSGDWYVHDGQKWTKAKPPIHSTPAAGPPPPPESPPSPPTSSAAAAAAAAAAAPTPPSSGTAASSPASSVPSSAPPAGGPVTPPGKATGGGRLAPRLLSAAPAGRGGSSLPTPVLFGIIGIVALIGIAIIVAAFLLVSGQLNGNGPTAQATASPTTALALVPTIAQPTLPPPPATNTAIPLPTLAISPTAEATATPLAATPVATKPAATKKPAATATPPAPTETKAPSLPPGVYVTQVRTDPSPPQFNQPTTFHVTFNNNTNELGPGSWFVKIFKCQAACTGDELADNKSIGETPKSGQQILPGTHEVAVGPWSIGLGGCNYVASPYYVNAQGVVVPFPVEGGNRMYYNFKMCSP